MKYEKSPSLKQLDDFHDEGLINNFEYMQLGTLYAIFHMLTEIRDLLKK